MNVRFVKATACGNDFLLIQRSEVAGRVASVDWASLTRELCDRHEGVGADGVEWMSPHTGADVAVELRNADGSEAEISGNGTRCVAASICAEEGKGKITILTGAGLKTCVLTGRPESDYEFEMDMGEPEVGEQFPVATSEGDVAGIPVSVGNPHFVVLNRRFSQSWQKVAAEIQGSARFNHNINIEMAMARNKREIGVVFFERGVGETQSSGTGSCAAALAAIAAGHVQSPVSVHAPGGTQTVRVETKHVYLRGRARLVCRGEFFL